MVKRLLCIAVIFLVCLTCIRFSMGVTASISTTELAVYITENSKTSSTIKEIVQEYATLIQKTNAILDTFKLDEVAKFLEEWESGNVVGNTITSLLAFIVRFVSGTATLTAMGGLLAVVLVQYGLPLLLDVLADLAMILEIISWLIFGASLPT